MKRKMILTISIALIATLGIGATVYSLIDHQSATLIDEEAALPDQYVVKEGLITECSPNRSGGFDIRFWIKFGENNFIKGAYASVTVLENGGINRSSNDLEDAVDFDPELFKDIKENTLYEFGYQQTEKKWGDRFSSFEIQDIWAAKDKEGKYYLSITASFKAIIDEKNTEISMGEFYRYYLS